MTVLGTVRFQETVLGLKMHEVQHKDESIINSKTPMDDEMLLGGPKGSLGFFCKLALVALSCL